MPLRKLILLFLLLPFFGVAQTVIPTGAVNQLTYQRGGYGADSVLAIPVKDTIYNGFPSYRLRGRLTLRPQDSVIYYHTGSYWKAVGTGSGGGGTYTSGYGINFVGNRIDVDTAEIAQLYKLDWKVDITDTANWINTIRVNPTMIKQGTDKDPILGVDTGVIATKSDIDNIPTPALQEVTEAGSTTTVPLNVVDVRLDTVNGYSIARAAASLLDGEDSFKVATCILRPAIDGGGNITWTLLNDADHMPVRFTTLSYSSGLIMTVNFAPTAKKIYYCSVTPDETLATYGVTAGAQANLTNIAIQLSWPKGNWAGLIFRDSTNTWRFSPNIASSQVIEYAPNGFEWVETSSSQMGGKLSAMSDYQGAVSAGYHYTYAGTNGYRLVKAQNFPYYLQKRMQLVDAYGNPVPLTSLTHLDMIQVNSNRSLQMSPQWNYNIWSLFSASSNLWITLYYK